VRERKGTRRRKSVNVRERERVRGRVCAREREGERKGVHEYVFADMCMYVSMMYVCR